MSSAYQRIVHKIDGPALVHCLWRRQRAWITHRQSAVFPYGENSGSAGNKSGKRAYGSSYCPACAAPEKAFKALSRIAFSRHGQCHNGRLITSRIRLISKYRPAQRKYPAGMTSSHSKLRGQTADYLTLYRWF